MEKSLIPDMEKSLIPDMEKSLISEWERDLKPIDAEVVERKKFHYI
jgi:hypothetical protein